MPAHRGCVCVSVNILVYTFFYVHIFLMEQLIGFIFGICTLGPSLYSNDACVEVNGSR